MTCRSFLGSAATLLILSGGGLIMHEALDIHPDLWLIGAVNVGLGLWMVAGAIWCKSDRE